MSVNIAVSFGDLIITKAAHRLDPRRRAGFFKAAGGAPFIVAGIRDQSVMHWIPMHVVQPGQITFLMRQMGFPIILPTLPARRSVETVQIAGNIAVQMTDKFHHGIRCDQVCRTMGNKVIVIGQHRPGFQPPTIMPWPGPTGYRGQKSAVPASGKSEISPACGQSGNRRRPAPDGEAGCAASPGFRRGIPLRKGFRPA